MSKDLFVPKKVPPMEAEVLFDGGQGASEAGWHSIQDMLTCAKEFQLRHVRGVRKPAAKTPDHFAWGILHHAGRARWFKKRFATDARTWREIEEVIKEESAAQKLPVSLKAEANALDLLKRYVDHWSTRPKPEPLAAEYKIGPAPLKPDDPFMLWRTARLDDVSKYPEAGGVLCLGESKTTSTSVPDTVSQYTLHGQTLMQLALYKLATQGEAKLGPAAGIMLDVAVKSYSAEKKPTFGRVFIPVSDWALQWYVDNLRVYLRAAAQIDWDTPVQRNITSCTRMAGRARIACEFRELCAMGKSAAGLYVLRDGNNLHSHKPLPGMEARPWE